jgi:F-type H+-transporting ATPase subunit b
MPQIGQLTESGYFISQLFWLVLVFGFIFLVIGLRMLPKVEATVDARDAQIAGDLAAAKAARDAADGIEEDWRNRSNAARAEAQTVMADAKAKAAKDAEKRLAKANADIDVRLAAAEAEIATARSSAMTEIEAVAVEAAQGLVTRLTGTNATTPVAVAAVKAQLHV